MYTVCSQAFDMVVINWQHSYRMLISKISALFRSTSTHSQVTGTFPSFALRMQQYDPKRKFIEWRAVYEIEDKFGTELHSVELHWL